MSNFRTKRGRCIIDQQNLYLSSSLLGLFKRYWEGGKTGKSICIFYALFFAWFGYMLAFEQTRAFNWGTAAGITMLIIGYLVNYARGFTYDHVISRESIEHIKANEGAQGFTRPRFVVKFEKGGEVKNRYIMMPSKWLSYGAEEFEEAKEKLKQGGLKVTE